MKKLIILSGLFLASFSLKAQTVKQDASGNYIAVKASHDSTGAVKTGKTFETLDGQILPIYKSKRGKYFVIRKSKSGTFYNQYLKL